MFYSVFIGTLWSEEILQMDPSRRGLYLLWHYIKYYFLINFFQDVTEGVNNSKNQASSFQSSSNNKDIGYWILDIGYFQRLLPIMTYVVAGLVTRDPDGELSRYRRSTLSATQAYWSLHGVIDISVAAPICYILFSFHWLMRYSAWHCLRHQDNSQGRHLLWSLSHMDYAAH